MTEYGSALDGHIVIGEPLVSVNVIAYNHGKYIRQCLDSILMQKVNFPYEILVHDDASPDDTADIIREYEARFPTVIKPIYQTENQYSKHDGTISKIQYGRAKGKYIAQCEGDDYWTDPEKLLMQVSFLEEHPEYVLCGHNVRCVDERGLLPKRYLPWQYMRERDYSLTDIINGKIWRVATLSAIYRNIFPTLSKTTLNKYHSISVNGDYKLNILLANFGKCHVFKKPMGIYRYITQSGTSYNARAKNKNLAEYNYYSHIYCADFLKSCYGHDRKLIGLLSREAASAVAYAIYKNNQDNKKTKTEILKDYVNRFGKKELIWRVSPLVMYVCIRYSIKYLLYRKIVDMIR